MVVNNGRPKSALQGVAMALMGVGLLVVGIVAAVLLLPKLMQQIQGQPEYQSAIPAAANYPAPDLELVDLQGNPVSLAALRGNVVLVNLWATWCPPCKAEMPTLNAYYEAYKDKGFLVVAIDDAEAADTVAPFVKDYGLTFPVWIDEDSLAMSAFKEEYLPTSYLLDRSGQVILSWGGPITRPVLEQYVTPLLEK
jgi:thiol-disulfide isomerase/thioredoxin